MFGNGTPKLQSRELDDAAQRLERDATPHSIRRFAFVPLVAAANTTSPELAVVLVWRPRSRVL
jgi:hypothetical protein